MAQAGLRAAAPDLHRWPVAGLGAWLLGLLLWLLAAGAGAQDLQAVPPLDARVVDTIAWLSAAARAALAQKLAAFEAEAGPQIVVLLIASTQPEDIASYAQRVADAWKIGRRELGDGVLLVAARDDRKLRIEVAKALEGAVPDLAARQIISQQISPAFKRGEVAAGLSAGVDALIARIRGEHLPAPTKQPGGGQRASNGFDWQTLAMFFFVGVPVVGGLLTSVMGRKLGSVATAGGAGALAFWLSTSLLVAGGAGLVALVLVGLLGVSSSAGRGRGGFGGMPPVIWGGGGRDGGGGGGFSTGGGGDFGGGGASGDW